MSTSTVPTLTTGTWAIDPAHSEVAFTVRHLMSKVRGTFSDFAGSVEVAGTDPTSATVSAEVQLASVSTNNAQRDGHLLSSDFFDAEAKPTMTFASTGISGPGTVGSDGEYVITGDLTINDVTRSVDLAAEFLGVDTDAYGATRLGVEATTTINRKDFGVDFNIPLDGGKLLIGDKVDVSLTIQAVLGS